MRLTLRVARPIRASFFCQSELVQGPEKRCFFEVWMDLSAGGDTAGPPVMRDPPGVFVKIRGWRIPIRTRNGPRSGKGVQRSLYWGRIGDGVKRENGGSGRGIMRESSGGGTGFGDWVLWSGPGNFCEKFFKNFSRFFLKIFREKI